MSVVIIYEAKGTFIRISVDSLESRLSLGKLPNGELQFNV